MSQVQMIECDNPKCNNIGQPEWLPPKGSRKKGYTGPYGWIQAQVGWVGSGPYLNVDACMLDCLKPAVEAKYEEFRREWDGDDR